MKMTIDILILGAGWCSTFMIPLCDEKSITYAATSRSGRDTTIKFVFNADSDDPEPYTVLPNARTILITFPIDKKGASERLVRLYSQSRGEGGDVKPRFIQLGTTNMWGGSRLTRGQNAQGADAAVQSGWYDRRSPYAPTPRAEEEAALLALSPATPTTVLNLAGLWGGSRSPKNWVAKIAPSKEALRAKGSLHLIHGLDVARCVLAVHSDFAKAQGQRWVLTDGRVYDWWDLASAWGSSPVPTTEESSSNLSSSEDRGPQAMWIRELMDEAGVRALPRNVELLGRALDSREFWTTFGLTPIKARVEV
ncbi:unnamed protein product [Cyclocybe aegerita]|uniref:Uncharacterized protein n=1 Tax=Cyclocybe aegerita TaxID=1973307 RepID=A0A8S0W011_CYCAE|nr:unnamed protein product [Cyclocybe aegerita]